MEYCGLLFSSFLIIRISFHEVLFVQNNLSPSFCAPNLMTVSPKTDQTEIYSFRNCKYPIVFINSWANVKYFEYVKVSADMIGRLEGTANTDY